MSSIARIQIRQDELSVDVANKLNVSGYGDASSQVDRRVFRWELVIEFDDVTTIEENNQVQRKGRQAGIRIDVDVLRAQADAKMNIYMVGLSVAAGKLDAKYSFKHYGLPNAISELLPKPSGFENVTAGKFQDLFASIGNAVVQLGKDGFAADSLPPTTDRFVRDNGNFSAEEQEARAVLYAVHSLRWALTGRTIWDAQQWSKRNDHDPSVVEDVYVSLGSHAKDHLIPRKDAWREAGRWLKLLG